MKEVEEKTHPFFTIEELLKIILFETQDAELKNFALVSKFWYSIALQLLPIKKLISEFHIQEAVVLQLKSPALVYERLSKILQRGKIEIFHEYTLYRLYCNDRFVHTSFVHLLDNNTAWFDTFFAKSDTFFLECNLMHACMIGNTDLVQFFIENKGLKTNEKHAYLAASSGQLSLVKYLIENQQCTSIQEGENSIFDATLLSGNVELFQYISSQFSWHPQESDFNKAIMSGSFELVKELHELYDFKAEDVTLSTIKYSRNLNLFHYLVSILNWRPDKEGVLALTETVYSMGILPIITYAERKFAFNITQLKLLDNAIESQDLKTFHYLCDTFKITKENIHEHTENCQLTLSKALKGGNIEIVKCLVETFCIGLESKNCLTLAIESGNPDLVDYLINTHHFKITTKETSKACQLGNLGLISKLYNEGHEFLPSQMGLLCFKEDSLMRLYHLLVNENYKACDVVLFNISTCYKYFNDMHLFYAFMDFFVGTYKLKPTIETIINISEDIKMVNILYNNPTDEESAPHTECRFF